MKLIGREVNNFFYFLWSFQLITSQKALFKFNYGPPYLNHVAQPFRIGVILILSKSDFYCLVSPQTYNHFTQKNFLHRTCLFNWIETKLKKQNIRIIYVVPTIKHPKNYNPVSSVKWEIVFFNEISHSRTTEAVHSKFTENE